VTPRLDRDEDPVSGAFGIVRERGRGDYLALLISAFVDALLAPTPAAGVCPLLRSFRRSSRDPEVRVEVHNRPRLKHALSLRFPGDREPGVR
jgi:hypothetical protein